MKKGFNKNKTDNRNVANIKRNRNLKHECHNIKSNTKKVVDNRNYVKENFEIKNPNAQDLNKALKEYFKVGECFKEYKNQKEALALLKKILKGTPPNEIYTMMDFLKNLLASESLKTQKINKNKTVIPKTDKNKATER